MFEMYPWMQRLHENPKIIDRLVEMESQGGWDELSSVRDWQYTLHARNMATQAVDQYAKALNVDAKTISPRALQYLASNFKTFIEEDMPNRKPRYDAGDARLVSEFIQDWTGIWVKPAAAAAATTAASAADRTRRLPSSGPSANAGGAHEAPARPRGKELREKARQFVLDQQGAVGR